MISACYIVKDEILTLPRSINSIRKFVDEIVIIDTGSSDGTDVYAKKVADIFHRYRWTGNFADARNFSLSKATSDWILVIDADETIDIDVADIFRKVIEKNQTADSFIFTIWNFLQDPVWVKNPNIFYGSSIRLFKNLPAIRYRGEIHNKLVGCKNIIDVSSMFSVSHHQYHERDKFQKKFDFYIANLNKRVDKDGWTVENCQHFCDMFRRRFIWFGNQSDLSNAIIYIDRALEIEPDNIKNHQVSQSLKQILRSLNAKEENRKFQNLNLRTSRQG